MRFANCNIGFRLKTGFGLVLLMLVGLVLFALATLDAIGSQTSKIIDKDWAKMAAINEIDIATRGNARDTLELFIAPDREHIERIHASIARDKKRIDENLQSLERLLYTEQGKRAAGQLKQDRMAYMASFDQVARLLEETQHDKATRLVLDGTLPALERLQASIQILKHQQQTLADSTSDTVREEVATASWLLPAMGAAALLAGIGFAWWITRSITAPVTQAVAVARTVASGNLASDIRVTSNDEMGVLLQSLKEMNASLLRVVGQVRDGTDLIASASRQIAGGSQELSGRTEQQAGALEETASSMEELTAAVRHNSANAQRAHQLAVSASDVALQGDSCVARMVDTMGDISASAKRIGDIIAVIDGIAFQTNILALNAAVEAARAGEQGRGFAVVASEVRNLAQRSAAAAKEIKKLVGDALDKVDVGNRLAGQAGGTMRDIVVSIRQVHDIMDDIALASREQETGIGQINQAMTQMDATTQQNAALVEESAAAAASLQEQASNLAATVAIFKLAPERRGS